MPAPPSSLGRPEILSPAGDPASLAAALAAGADAVYFGLDDGFNARARATNFQLATLPGTVTTIHRAGAKAYVTLNTLVFEPELADVTRILSGVAAAGVDAIIVQDPGVALLARAVCPELSIHGSTQMTVSSAGGAAFAKTLGVSRIVVPRELDVDEIGTLAEATDLELEVFVHGALCVSWSGQCLTSEAWGGRSANRGQCAQSCRMPYDLVVDGERKDLGDVRYLLSPKDLAGLRAVPSLSRIGVHGLKIEGRQKGPQYVASATSGYAKWVRAVAGGAPTPESEAEAQADLADMALSYTRGFGDGFLVGSDHQTLVEGRFPKHRGLYLGRVTRIAAGEVWLDEDPDGRPWTGALAVPESRERTAPEGRTRVSLPILGGSDASASGPRAAPLEVRPGMGVVFDAGRPEEKDEPGGPVFRVRTQGRATVLGFGTPGPDLARVSVGDRVWVTQDPAVTRRAEKLVATAPEGRIPVTLAVTGRAGEPLVVTARAGALSARAVSDVMLAPSSGKGLARELLAEKLGAFGGTPFRLDALDASGLAPELHVPVSALKALRRALAASLDAALDAPPVREVSRDAEARVRAGLPQVSPLEGPVTVVPLCRTEDQIRAAAEAGAHEVELDWMELVGLGTATELARSLGLRVTAAMLRIEKPGEEGITTRIARLAPDGILVRHWGALMRFGAERAPGGPLLVGDYSLNVTNSITARHLLSLGLDLVTASFDLDESQLVALLAAVPRGRVAVVVHHRIPTFHTEHCVYAHLLSNGRDYRTCGRPCEAHRIDLRDHLGNAHPVIVDAGCRNTVFNADAQSAAPLVPRLLEAGVRRLRVDFVRETRDEARAVLLAYGALARGEIAPAALMERLAVGAQIGVGRGKMALLSTSAR